MAEIIRDRYGQVRRLGSFIKPQGFVSAFRTFEEEHPVWDDADIKRALLDPNRRIARQLFGDKWITDQKSHGSCNGFAGAAALSRARYLRGIQDGLILSGAYLYSKINGGRDNGSLLEDGMRAIQEFGCPPADVVTWDMIYPSQQPRNADEEAAKHKGLEGFAVQTKQGLRTAGAAGYPLIVAVHVGRRFETLTASGVCGVDSGPGNHAVCVDDMRLIHGEERFDHAGSWNLGFGERGRGYLVWDHFAQTFDNHVFYALASTEERQ